MGQTQTSLTDDVAQVIKVAPKDTIARKRRQTINVSSKKRKQSKDSPVQKRRRIVSPKRAPRNAVTPIANTPQQTFQQMLTEFQSMPQSHQVLFQTFSLISNDRKTITLEALSNFISKHTDQEIDYYTLRELMHTATNSYEITYDDFLRIMLAEESQVKRHRRRQSITCESTKSKPSLDMRSVVEQRKNDYGIYKNQALSFAARSTSPSNSSFVPGLDTEFGPLFTPTGAFNPHMKRHKSLNHTQNVMEKACSTMEQAFRAFDIERRGELTQDNIVRVMEAVGFKKPSKKEMQSLYRSIGKKNSKENLNLEDFTRLFVVCQDDIATTQEVVPDVTVVPGRNSPAKAVRGCNKQSSEGKRFKLLAFPRIVRAQF